MLHAEVALWQDKTVSTPLRRRRSSYLKSKADILLQQKRNLTSYSYLLDLEARIKAYESERDGPKPTQSEVVDADSSTPQSSTPQSLSSSFEPLGSETGKDDIDKNPLIEGTAQLVLNPEGEQRIASHFCFCSLALTRE